ncbi:thyrostimulin alpha-2 subunit-like [Littorina saxatilis]|uniref:thyrostimulin alpha-2 subunit-like n=1 Tax=Littorina saxatilis TaxID=31220 RepID=UPI0038B42DC0
MKSCLTKGFRDCHRHAKTSRRHRWTFSSVMTVLCFLVCGHLEQCAADSSSSSSSSSSSASAVHHSWQAPGCHLVGHTRVVKIPGCVPFQVTTNACRGFCLSYAIPSPTHTLAYNPDYVITSRAECCGITDTHDVPVQVRCVDGVKEIVFKSARSCGCSLCRRE